MHLELPDDIVKRAEVNNSDLCLALAVQLYSDNRIDYNDACILSGLSGKQINLEFIRRGIPVLQYPDASQHTCQTD